MEYNTQRSHLVISEYGRCIQEMAQQLLLIEDAEKRQKNAEAIVEVMAIINSQLKGIEDYKQKFWDHLYTITDYKLEINSPYGIPERETKQAKPQILPYPKNKLRFNHLGKGIEQLIAKATAETDPEKKAGFAQVIGNYMKVAYKNNHNENANDEMVREELLNISKGELEYEIGAFKKYVDVTLNESTQVANVKNEIALPKNNRNYGNNNRNKSNFQNNRSSNNNNRFSNNKFKNKK